MFAEMFAEVFVSKLRLSFESASSHQPGSCLSETMVRRAFVVSLLILVNPLLFEVVEAQKSKSPPSCSSVGDVNATVHSQRNETCGTAVNLTTIQVCEDGGNNGPGWREICDETFTQQDAKVLCMERGFSDTGAVGRLDQSISFPSTFSPECNGQESSISDCTRIARSGDCTFGKIIVTCVKSMSCTDVSSTNASSADTSNSELPLPSTTSVVSPPQTTSGPGVYSTDDSNTDLVASDTNLGGPGSSKQASLDTTIIIVIAVCGVIVIVMLILVIVVIAAALICKRSSRRKQNFNDQVSPDSPVKVRNPDPADRYKDLEPSMYSELNNNTVIQHQVPVYDTVKNKSQNLSEVSASDSNEDVDNHTYSALDPEAIYSQISPHLGLGPGNSKTLPVGLKDVSPSTFYQTLDRSLSLPRTSGSSDSASGYMLTHAVNRTALALASGNISETDLASPRSDASIKYPSPHGSPKQHHSSQSSTSKEEVPLNRNPTNAQMENYYHVLDQGVPSVAATSAINTTANSDIDSQVSTDAVCNHQIMDDRRQPHCHSPRRQRQRVGAADETIVAEGGDQQHVYAILEPSVRAQLTPPSRHDTRQRSQSTLNNRSPPQQQRMRSNTARGDVHVNYSGQRAVNNLIQPSLHPEVTNTLV